MYICSSAESPFYNNIIYNNMCADDASRPQRTIYLYYYYDNITMSCRTLTTREMLYGAFACAQVCNRTTYILYTYNALLYSLYYYYVCGAHTHSSAAFFAANHKEISTVYLLYIYIFNLIII